MDRAYLAGLRVPLIGVSLVLLLALASVMPGSRALASGWIAARADLGTLSIDPEGTWTEIVKLTGLAAAFVLAHVAVRHRRRGEYTLRVFAWLSTVLAVWALILYAAVEAGGSGVSRLSGTFVSPNVAGCMLAIGWFCWLGMAASGPARGGDRARRLSLAEAAAGLVLATALLLTASRSSIVLALALSLMLMAPSLVRRWRAARGLTRTPLVIGILAACLATGILAQSAAGVMVRIGGLGPELENRTEILRTYAGVAGESPALGHGLGTVPRISRLLLTPANDAVMWNVRAAHNLILQWWIEMGVVGLAAAAAGLASLLWIVLHPGRGDGTPLRAPVACVSAFILFQGLVDYSAQIYSICLSWTFLLGLAYSVRTTPISTRTPSARAGKTGGPRGTVDPGRRPGAWPVHPSGFR